MITLNQRSTDRLKSVHQDLRRIIERAAKISKMAFIVTEGIRTLERQKELLKLGATRTLKSRHLTGHAVDLAPLDAAGKVRWDWPLFYTLAATVKQAAADCAIPIEWGGDWTGGFKDGPHFQLPWKSYPK